MKPTHLCTLPASKITSEGFAPFLLFFFCFFFFFFENRRSLLPSGSLLSKLAFFRDRRRLATPARVTESLKSGLFPVPTLEEHITKHRLCLSSKLKNKNSRSKPCWAKKVPQKSTESNASCTIKRPGCPEPRARAVTIQSVYSQRV